MNVLVIAPHPDDETIGCGGTLCLHSQRRDRTAVAYLTSGELGLKHLPREEATALREEEARGAARLLGVAELYFLRQPDWMLSDQQELAAQALHTILVKENPSLIYAPHPADRHPDHQISLAILRRALSKVQNRPEIRLYEVWTPLAAFDHLEDVSAVMKRKLRALRVHRSQLTEFDYERAVTGLNAYRGELEAKCRYAEVFARAQWKETP